MSTFASTNKNTSETHIVNVNVNVHEEDCKKRSEDKREDAIRNVWSTIRVACQMILITNQARHAIVNAREPYGMVFETTHTLLRQSMDPMECNRIDLKEDMHCNHVTALFVSIYNKTKGRYEVEACEHFSLVLNHIVLVSLDQLDIAHNQMIATDGSIGQHIIIPFSPKFNKYKQDVKCNSYININKCPDPHILIDMNRKHIVDGDAYEVQISCSNLTIIRSFYGQGELFDKTTQGRHKKETTPCIQM